MKIDSRLLKYLSATITPFISVVLIGIASALLIIQQARLISLVISRVFLQGYDIESNKPLLLMLLAVFLGRSLLVWAGETTANRIGAQIKQRLRSQLIRKLFEFGPIYTTDERSGELSVTLIQGVEALETYFSQYLPQLLLAVVIPLATLVVVLPLDLLSGTILLVTAPLIPFFMILIGNTAESLTRRQWTSLSRLSAHFLDTLQGLATLKALNRSRDQATKIADVSERYRQATMNVLRVTFLSALALELLATLSTAIIAVEIGIRLMYGQMEYEKALFILIIAPDYYQVLRQLGMRFHAAISGVSAAQRIFEILDTQIEGESQTKSTRQALTPDQQDESTFWRFPPQFTISFSSVSYAYQNRQLDALKGLSFSLQSGSIVALTGTSGSGKSTVASLLLRFIQPQSGQIHLDNVPVHTIPLALWRSQIAWMPQKPYLFKDTVAENIRIGSPGAPIEKVREAAKLAQLDDEIQAMPGGYEMIIEEQGSRLSGGQAQRLALARAFLRNAPILILDEPTTYLDPENEDKLISAIRCLCLKRTVLLIAHSQLMVAQADRVFRLQNGMVVEL